MDLRTQMLVYPKGFKGLPEVSRDVRTNDPSTSAAYPKAFSSGCFFIPEKHQRISQKLPPILARNSVKFLTFGTVLVVFSAPIHP